MIFFHLPMNESKLLKKPVMRWVIVCSLSAIFHYLSLQQLMCPKFTIILPELTFMPTDATQKIELIRRVYNSVHREYRSKCFYRSLALQVPEYRSKIFFYCSLNKINSFNLTSGSIPTVLKAVFYLSSKRYYKNVADTRRNWEKNIFSSWSELILQFFKPFTPSPNFHFFDVLLKQFLHQWFTIHKKIQNVW